MMIKPTKEENEMFETLEPWLKFDGKKFVLKDGAPKKAKEAYGVYWAKYGRNFE